ncbi:hypothetical protein ALC62_03994 [Cyphomyrmex costatus]|uniref:THAP-type domain-containing protein n=1 Tax=Cyphomyrmex costatus TaxID=456900 RepID=A0A195CX05_9HYME|nr:hypothetical protein ALC62_03994 [Cyphomyrmex costatus]
MSCWIRGCPTKDGSEKRSLFTPFSDEMFNNWCDSGLATKGVTKFSKKSRVCELHFPKDDIIREDTFYLRDGTTSFMPRKIPKLKKGAVPSILPPEVSYYHINAINEEINYYRVNVVDKLRQKQQRTGETNIIVTQSMSMFNYLVFVYLICAFTYHNTFYK